MSQTRRPEPLQYTRALAALGTLDVCLDNLGKFCSGELLDAVHALRGPLEECEAITRMRKRPLSRGAQRAFDGYAESLESMASADDKNQAAREATCAAMLEMAFILALDVFYSCPAYSGGKYENAWQELICGLGELSDGLAPKYRDMRTRGEAFYDSASPFLG